MSGLQPRPEESYRLCCVVVCDLETSRIGAPYIYDISNLRVKIVFFIIMTVHFIIFLIIMTVHFIILLAPEVIKSISLVQIWRKRRPKSIFIFLSA